VHPDCSVVLPLCPEPITREDGKKKNDCERNAANRLLRKIIVVKQDDHKELFELVQKQMCA
jgi:hypothetical protein